MSLYILLTFKINGDKVTSSLSNHQIPFWTLTDQICIVIELVKQNGTDSSRFPYDGEMSDEDDRVFYEDCLSKEDSFLVTSNLKHYPKEPQVITAAEMMEILDYEL